MNKEHHNENKNDEEDTLTLAKLFSNWYVGTLKGDFMKKFMPIIYVIAFVIGIIFIVTADTGLITSYYPALIAGIIISCFSGVFLAIYLYAWHKQSK